MSEEQRTQEDLAVYTSGLLGAFASSKRIITYQELAFLQGVESGSREQKISLNDVMHVDIEEDRGLTCSLVVSAHTYLPSKGFISEARENGYEFKDEERFIREQQRQCFKEWDIKQSEESDKEDS